MCQPSLPPGGLPQPQLIQQATVDTVPPKIARRLLDLSFCVGGKVQTGLRLDLPLLSIGKNESAISIAKIQHREEIFIDYEAMEIMHLVAAVHPSVSLLPLSWLNQLTYYQSMKFVCVSVIRLLMRMWQSTGGNDG